MIKLEASTRKVAGKKNKSLLREGIAPGSIDRNKQDTIMIQADQINLIPLDRSKGAEKVEVTVDGKDTFVTVISEMYVNPLNNKVESFSLTELTPESHVTVRVPIVFEGVSPAVKNNLGVLVINLPSLRITANSENLIEQIVVDIAKLENVGARLLVAELPGIENIKLASEKDRSLTVVTIRPLQKVDILKTTAEAAEGEEGDIVLGEDGEPIETAADGQASEAEETTEE